MSNTLSYTILMIVHNGVFLGQFHFQEMGYSIILGNNLMDYFVCTRSGLSDT